MSREKRQVASWKKGRRFLEETTTVRVRFGEVDSMQIVWHGHYVVYFEDARRAFGRRYGLDYPVFLQNGVGAPVVHVHTDYLAPARMDDTLEVTARLYESDGAKLEFGYEARRAGGGPVLVTGATVQVFTTPAGDLLLTPPPFVTEFYRQWENQWRTEAGGA